MSFNKIFSVPFLLFQVSGVGVGTQVPPLMPEMERYMRKMQLQNQREFQFWNTQPVPKISEWYSSYVF